MDFMQMTAPPKKAIARYSTMRRNEEKIREQNHLRKVGKNENPPELLKNYKEEEESRLRTAYAVKELASTFSIDAKAESVSSGSIFDIAPIVSHLNTQTDQHVQFKRHEVFGDHTFEKCDPAILKLPIVRHRQEFLTTLGTHRIVIVKGATGCGKSTQIPQFILEDCYKEGLNCNVVVTQPRKIAARSIAKRVCSERGWELGKLVGYQVGQERAISDQTRLTYMTTGVMLKLLVGKKSLSDYTHIILDEIHEREKDMDFLLIIVRRFLFSDSASKNCKLIMMSATINTDCFTRYFSFISDIKIPVLIADSALFRVDEYYLDDMGLEDKIMDINEPCIDDDIYAQGRFLCLKFDEIDGGDPKRGAVLIFLPGIHEINRLHAMLEVVAERENWWLLKLHSTSSAEEQENVFRSVQPGWRKIILSTNIAESSVTVPDIRYVIDFCLTKHLFLDNATDFTVLKLCFASKSNCIQRKGRAGRLGNGRVYRLVTKHFYECMLNVDPLPEIIRCPLYDAVLDVKNLGMGSPLEILGAAMDPPTKQNICSTVLRLKEVGALNVLLNGEVNLYDGDITKLGKVIAMLPVDIHLGKLIYLGHLFNVEEDAIIIATSLAGKSMWRAPSNSDELDLYNMKLGKAEASMSDLIANCKAFREWRRRVTEGRIMKSTAGRKLRSSDLDWATSNFVDLRQLEEMAQLQDEIRDRLKGSPILGRMKRESAPMNGQKLLILKVVICGAFYPNYFVMGSRHTTDLGEEGAVKILNGLDPYSTVYLQGLPPGQHGILYTDQVKKYFQKASKEISVSFDNSQKIFVNFGYGREVSKDVDGAPVTVQIPGKVNMAVYRALKLGQCRNKPMELEVLGIHDAQKIYGKFERMFQGHSSHDAEIIRYIPWPWNYANVNRATISRAIPVVVTHVNDPGSFWIQSLSVYVVDKLNTWYCLLNKEGVRGAMVPLNADPTIGRYYAGRDPTLKEYYRCRIIRRVEGKMYEVLFVDFGNTEIISDIMEFGREMVAEHALSFPDLAVQCSLMNVKPNILMDGKGLWSSESADAMTQWLNDAPVDAIVYALVNRKMAIVTIQRHRVFNPDVDVLNEFLVKENIALRDEENYLAKYSHNTLLRGENMNKTLTSAGFAEDIPEDVLVEAIKQLHTEAKADVSYNRKAYKVRLKGPMSPLTTYLNGMTKNAVSHKIDVEWNSVNSILLNTEPHNPHQTLMVASTVRVNPEGGKLSLFGTTLMPSSPGFASLACLLFAPRVELRHNPEATRVTGALCGLGYDPSTGDAIYQENDMEIVFDTKLDNEIIMRVNRIRYWMDSFISNNDFETKLLYRNPQELWNDIICLTNPRPPQAIHHFSRQYQWNVLRDERKLRPSVNWIECEQQPSIFPIIWGINLFPRRMQLNSDDYFKECQLKTLKAFANAILPGGKEREVECPFCQILLQSPDAAKIHLDSKGHRALFNDWLTEFHQAGGRLDANALAD